MGFTSGLRAFSLASIVAATVIFVAAPVTAASSTAAPVASTAAARVVHIAELQRGKGYAYGAEGPSAFDCSGLVLYSYRRAGVGSRLGGGHSGYGMLSWARAHHLASRTNGQVGDVVIYGGGSHAAIYIGNGLVISALNPSQGIRITRLNALGAPFTAFIHTHLGKAQAKVVRSARAKVAPVAAHRTVVARTWVNLRAGDSTGTRLLATVRPGVRLAVTGAATRAGSRWYHVLYRGRAAWVRADLVRAA